jgi:hypothetical protein
MPLAITRVWLIRGRDEVTKTNSHDTTTRAPPTIRVTDWEFKMRAMQQVQRATPTSITSSDGTVDVGRGPN